MPVVPYVRKQDSRSQGFSPAKPIDIPAADEPWVLMAAAQMDAQGRLVEVEDRRDEPWPWHPAGASNRVGAETLEHHTDVIRRQMESIPEATKLSREAGSADLDKASRK